VHDAVIITKDEDFSDMAVMQSLAPAIIWVRVGNTTRRALLEWFEPLIDDMVAHVDAGERVIELR